MAAINLDIGGDTRRLDRDIRKTVNQAYTINLKTKGEQPLGRITGKVNEFNKSLDASNARVIAFGASAGLIFGVQRAFSALVSTTIEVQKSLQDINVILNVSTSQLQKFGSGLFDIAKNTGQSFQVVAQAATELSRQGLGVEETLKRTSEALILSRLSGLDATKSVEALTAAVNSYASQAVTASEVVNKFANVDAAFAVSSKDLAEALSRVGSSAAQSGVNLNELIAIVTSAQQTTARGGAVIGNSFKTIFTRLQRGKVVNLLEDLGVDTTDSSGQIKSTINLLKDLASVYDNLGTLEQADVAEKVGGVFQINILKAALADLGKEFSIYDRALQIAGSSTDQAIKRNEELNKTFSAQINVLQENVKQLSSNAGERLLTPVFDTTVGNLNQIFGSVNESDSQSIGATLGKGILDGLGQILAGPGLALVGGVFIKLFTDLGKFATDSVKTLLGLNNSTQQQQNLQQSIQQILSKNPDLIALMSKGTVGVNKAAEILLTTLRAQTVELQKQEQFAGVLSKKLFGSGVRVREGVPIAPTPSKPSKAAGYIPNFSEVSQAIKLGAPSSVQSVSGVGKIGGKSFEANNKEFQIPDFGGTGETAVIPKYGGGIKEATKMIARGESGSVLDKSERNKARGFVPNFAQNIGRGYSVFDGDSLKVDQNYPDKRLQGKEMRLESVDAIESWQKYGKPETQKLAERIIYNEFPNVDSALKSSGKTGRAAYDRPYFNSTNLQNELIKNGLGIPDLRYGSSLKGLTMGVMNAQPAIGLWSDKNKDGFYNHPKAQQFIKQNNLEKKLSSRTNLSKNQKNFILGSAVGFGTGRYTGELLPDTIKSKGKPGSKNYKPERAYNYQRLSRASGFIPNFAQTKKAIDLGNLDTIPNELGNKVVSLIYPGLSDGYSLSPATASYLKQEYRGNIPVAGINQTKLKSQIPDLDKNLGDLLVKEANQFGQSLGGSNFLKSAEDLPNYGAAKGAVGVAFEGGVQTLLQQKIGRKQNAGIDFRNITPRLRSIFNDAPGMYDAKSSPALTNEVFKKLLNETKPGAIVPKSSGQAGKDYLAKRSAAVAELKKEGVTGSVAIRQALKDRFGILGKASGYIPNFAAIQDAVSRERAAGVPSNQIYLAQEKALTGANPMGIGVFNKTDEPTAGKRREQMKRKGFARGFVPNFALDTAPADLGSSVVAVGIQLASLTFFLGNYETNLKEAQAAQITSLNESIAAQKQQLQTIKQTTGESSRAFQRLNKSIVASQAQLASGPGFLGKLDARFSALTTALGSLGPIIASTIANAIGRESKGARIGSTIAEGSGQALAFASAGNVFGKKYRNIGLAIGTALTAINVFKEATTSLPELQAAADKSAQSLTKFNEASDRVIQSFEKIKELREGGQPEKAAKLQTQLLRDIESFENPETRQQARAAIITKDQKGLTTALERGFEEREKANQIDASLIEIPTAVKGLEGIDSQIGKLDFFAGLPGARGFVETKAEKEKLGEKRIGEVDKLFSNLGIFSGKGFEPGQEALGSFTKIQSQLDAGESFETIFKDSGADPKVIAALTENEAVLRESLNEALKKRIALEELTIQNTGQGNKVVESINSAFEDLKKNIDNYSKSIQATLSNQISGRVGIEESLGRVRTQSLISRGEIETEFGATQEGRATGIQAELSDINENFNSSIRESMGASFQALIPILASALPQITDLTTTAQPGAEGPQERSEAAILAVQEALTGLGDKFDLSKVQELLGGMSLSDVGETGIIDPVQIISQIKEAFKDANIPPDKFDALENALRDQNSVLTQSIRIQEEQKIILAQQKFTENVKLLLTAIKSSFGGLEGFLKNNFTENIEQVEDSTAGLRTLGTPEGNIGEIEVARDLGTLVQELSRLAGRSIGPALEGGADNEVIQSIIRGQGLEIGETIQSTLDSLTGFEGAGDLADAFIKTLQDTLGTEETDPNKLGEQISKIQATSSNELGKVDQKILDQAIKDLGIVDPEIAEKLKQSFELGLGLEDTEQLLKLQFVTANGYLKTIADKIDKAIVKAEEEKGAPLVPGTTNVTPATPASDIPSSASGSLPKGMRIANDKEFISKNFAKESRQQSRYGYSGGNPVLLSGFDDKKDAIFNPEMIKKMGMPPNAMAISAGGYIPVVAKNFGFGKASKKEFLKSLISAGLSAKDAIKYEKILRLGSDLEKAKFSLGINKKLNLLPQESFLRSGANKIFDKIKNDNKFTGKLARYANGGIGNFFKTPGILGKGKALGRGISRSLGPVAALIEGSRGGLAAARGGEELEAYFDYTQNKFTTSGFSDIGSAVSNTFEGLFDPVGLGASLIGGVSEAIELSEGDPTQVLLDLVGLGDKRRQAKIDEDNRRSQEQIKRLQEQSSRGVIFGERPQKRTPTEIPSITDSQSEIQKQNSSLLSKLPEPSEFKFQLAPTKELKIDDIKNISPKKLEEQRKKKQKLIDDNINLNLLRWSAGTEAQFKQYDKDGNFNGVTELFGKTGRPEFGSRAELNTELIKINDQIKANRNPRESLALAKRARSIQEKIQGDTTQSQFRGKLFEGPAGQELLKTEGFKGKEVVNPNEITRAITDKNGKIVGYARNSKQNTPQRLKQDPNLKFSLEQEKLETGLGDQDIYTKKLPELRKLDNPEGVGVFNREQEGNTKLERQAIQEEERLSRIVKKPNLGSIPNFAQDSSASNINVGPINVNLSSSVSKNQSQEYGEEFRLKLEEQIAPLLEQIKQELDQKYGRASETVSNLIRGNNLPNYVPPPTNRSNQTA
jgi:TP901 family phage tail tape measure protein